MVQAQYNTQPGHNSPFIVNGGVNGDHCILGPVNGGIHHHEPGTYRPTTKRTQRSNNSLSPTHRNPTTESKSNKRRKPTHTSDKNNYNISGGIYGSQTIVGSVGTVNQGVHAQPAHDIPPSADRIHPTFASNSDEQRTSRDRYAPRQRSEYSIGGGVHGQKSIVGSVGMVNQGVASKSVNDARPFTHRARTTEGTSNKQRKPRHASTNNNYDITEGIHGPQTIVGTVGTLNQGAPSRSVNDFDHSNMRRSARNSEEQHYPYNGATVSERNFETDDSGFSSREIVSTPDTSASSSSVNMQSSEEVPHVSQNSTRTQHVVCSNPEVRDQLENRHNNESRELVLVSVFRNGRSKPLWKMEEIQVQNGAYQNIPCCLLGFRLKKGQDHRQCVKVNVEGKVVDSRGADIKAIWPFRTENDLNLFETKRTSGRSFQIGLDSSGKHLTSLTVTQDSNKFSEVGQTLVSDFEKQRFEVTLGVKGESPKYTSVADLVEFFVLVQLSEGRTTVNLDITVKVEYKSKIPLLTREIKARNSITY